jgi:hypothetical protein
MILAGAAALAAALGAPSRQEGAPRGGPDPKCGLAWRLAESGLAGEEDLPAIMVVPATPVALQSERIIGKFRIHYDTAGPGAPALLDAANDRIPGSHEQFVDSAGAILNEVYSFETAVLGYADPIQPSQGVYDVYVFDNMYYGETVPGNRIGTDTPPRYVSHMNIDNDFRNFYTKGMAGLRVTAAHEFFHAIQFGSYGYWSSDIYFMELTSTWMEEAVYDGINDYYQYLRGNPGPGGYAPRGHFARPDFTLTGTDGLTEYSRAVLCKFIEKRYSRDVIRRAWELIPGNVAVDALDLALAGENSSFREAFLLWAAWNGQTGPTADTAAYYAEGREYPRVVTAPLVGYVSPGRDITDTISTASAGYYPVTVGSTTMSVIVANVRARGAPAAAPFTYRMADRGDETFRKLANGISVRLDVADPANWSTIESAPEIREGVTTAPNPFSVTGSRAIDFYVPMGSPPGSVRLTVLRASMEGVFEGALSLREDLATPFVQVAEWNARDRFDRELSSGVYLYVLTVDGAEHTGKFSVVR